ncbi:hypothetical protein [Pseudoneobacillus sp. C159]
MSRFLSVICVLLLLVGSCFFWQNQQVEAASSKLILVKGTILKGKVPIGKGTVTTYSKSTNKAYYSTIKNGQFQLNVPIGEYNVHSYTDHLKKSAGNIYHSFTVRSGVAAPNIKIQLKEDNIKGLVQPVSGKISDGTLYFIKHDQALTEYFTVIRNNQFQLPLENGTYTAYQYVNKSDAKYYQVDSTFTVSNGKLTTASLKIQGQPTNISGSVKLSSQKNINGTVKIVCQSCEREIAYTATVKNGKYEASLSNGHYKIANIYNQATKKTNPYSFVFEVKQAKVTAAKMAMALVVDRDNLKGTIEKGGKPITKGNLFIYPTNGEGYYYYPDITNGQFTTFLKDGSYNIDGYFDESQQQNVPLETPIKFVVTGGKSSLPNLVISMPADNFIGTVHKAGVPIAKGTIYAKTDLYTRVVSIYQGKFTAYLKDGTYTIQKARDDVAYLDYEFEPILVKVESGKLTSSKPLKIDILEDNVSGVLLTSSGVLKSGAFYVIADTGKEYKFPIYDGKFSMNLPDGAYKIGPIFDYSGGNKAVDFSFTVKSGKLVEGPSLEIFIADDNFSGMIVKTGTSIKKGAMILHSATGNNHVVQIEDNRYSDNLPNGVYRVTAVVDTLTNLRYELSIPISISIVNGKLANPVSILIQEVNVKITVENSFKLVSGRLELRDKYGKVYSFVIQEGRLVTYLANGDYVITSFFTESGLQIPLGLSFSVIDGKTSPDKLAIKLLENNIDGTVTKAGKIVESGYVIVQSTFADYSIPIQNGKISTYLPDGNYKIIQSYDKSSLQEAVEDISFTVSNGKPSINPFIILLQEDNLQGTLLMGNSPAKDGVIYLIGKNNKKDYRFFVRNGTFSGSLPDGEYQVVRYISNGSVIDRKWSQEFTISNGQLSKPLLISLPDNNFTGTVEKSGEVIQLGTMTIKNKETMSEFIVRIKDGVFTDYLADGRYMIINVSSNTIRNHYEEIHFQVEDGLISISTEIKLKEDNVIGTVRKNDTGITGSMIIKQESGPFRVRLAIMDGKLSTYLPDGIYKVISIYSQNGKSEEFDTTSFIVSGGSLQGTLDIQLK